MHRSPLALLTLGTIAVAGCGSHDAAPDTPYAREVAEAIPRIEAAVGLKYRTPPKLEERSKDQVRKFLEDKFNESLPASEIAGQQSALRVLGLIPDTMQLRPFLLDLLTEQIVGYYDPRTKVLYVVKGADPTMASMTVTHELVHALQDQYINLDSIQNLHSDGDRSAAAQAVIEGQAVYEQLRIATNNDLSAIPGGWEGIRESVRKNSAQMPLFSRAPLYIQETLIFPYLSGADFVKRYEDVSPGKQPFTRMPSSTEQVMHPRAYESSPPDEPTSVTLPAPRNATRVYDDVFGEFGARLFIFQHLRDQAAAVRGANGWDGDRLMVVRTPKGEGIVWYSVWDTALDAGEFADILKSSILRRFGNQRERAIAGGTEYSGTARTLRITGGENGGRSYVLYVDVPAGASADVLDAGAVKLGT
jgi:hypothetical protein